MLQDRGLKDSFYIAQQHGYIAIEMSARKSSHLSVLSKLLKRNLSSIQLLSVLYLPFCLHCSNLHCLVQSLTMQLPSHLVLSLLAFLPSIYSLPAKHSEIFYSDAFARKYVLHICAATETKHPETCLGQVFSNFTVSNIIIMLKKTRFKNWMILGKTTNNGELWRDSDSGHLQRIFCS